MSAEAAQEDGPPARPVKRALLRWTGRGLVFEGGAPEGPRVVVDGDGAEGASPMDHLLLSLAGCMGSDVRHILEKSRVPVESLEVEVEGTRAPTDPRRYQALRLSYRIRGPRPGDLGRLERAVELSRTTYCSVLHSLRQDIEIEIAIERI